MKISIELFQIFVYLPVSFDVGTGGAFTSAPCSNRTRPTST